MLKKQLLKQLNLKPMLLLNKKQLLMPKNKINSRQKWLLLKPLPRPKMLKEKLKNRK
jgi:hypothetical protein